MFSRKSLVLAFACYFAVNGIAFADSEGPPKPYVKASALGGVYAKCFPEQRFTETGDRKGRTEIYRITEQGEQKLCSFDWYSNQIYIADTQHLGGDGVVLVKKGAWPQGGEPSDDWLAIAFYKDCQEVKRYSTADIVRLGYKDPQNIIRTVSHYEVFGAVKGFRQIPSGEYAFDILTAEGNVLSFNTATGALKTPDELQSDQIKTHDFLKKMCDESQGSLSQEVQADEQKAWICSMSAGGTINFGPVEYYLN